MKKLFTNLALGLLAVVAVLFIVANRESVNISFWPLPYYKAMPLYLVFFIGLFTGLVLAGVIGVVRRARSFARARRTEKQAQRLQAEVESLEQELDAGSVPGSEPGTNEGPTEIPRLPPDVP